DGPTGAFVLANYYQAIKDLKKKEAASSRENAFHPMYHKMITKLEEYQEEALECEPLVMATLLHPAFRLRFFAHFWPKREPSALIREELSRKKNSPKVDNDTAAKDQKSLLIWWKDHSKTFSVLSSLAKDYLASSASSCASERMFSSAADVCFSGCGSLNPRTIERCEILRRLKK
ncbi:hypothetical protein VP01_10307g1, partial [Puccinia sorghi]